MSIDIFLGIMAAHLENAGGDATQAQEVVEAGIRDPHVGDSIRTAIDSRDYQEALRLLRSHFAKEIIANDN